MEIYDGEARFARLEEALAAISTGDFEQTAPVADVDDPLAKLEMGINFMLMDLRASARANEEKEARLVAQQEEMAVRMRTIEEQNAAIRDLSTPVMEIWDDVLVLPIIGVVDTTRSVQIMDVLLQRIVEHQARCVIIDITGVDIVDTKTGDYLLKVVRAARLLGSRCVLTGLRPAVAQTLVEIGSDLTEVATLRNLKEGLKDCLAHLHRTARAQ
jgi:rsbT co-antagonist protein RsbR